MLDNFLGNVFGRSKKTGNNPNANNGNNGPNGEPCDGFVVVGQTNQMHDPNEEQNLYPRVANFLTQEMIVNSSGQSVSRGQSSSAVIVGHRTDVQSYSSPIDNIPFTTGLSSNNEGYDNQLMSDTRCLETINRIQQFIASSGQSEYSFHLENTILSESLLS